MKKKVEEKYISMERIIEKVFKPDEFDID